MNTYYYTFDWTPSSGRETSLWCVARLNCDLDDADDLVAFINEMESQYTNFMLTYWKKLTDKETK